MQNFRRGTARADTLTADGEPSDSEKRQWERLKPGTRIKKTDLSQ